MNTRGPRSQLAPPLPLLLAWVAIVGVGIAVYANSLHGPFIFDDLPWIRDNPRIRSLWPIWESLRIQAASLGRPVVSLSWSLDYALYGLDVRGYHVTSIAVHILCSLVAFALVRRTLRTGRLRARYRSSACPLALLVALVWLVHPLQTECVNYISSRTESLMALFYLLTLYCVNRSIDSQGVGLWSVAAVVACALGMLSKEVMVTAPLVALLYESAARLRSPLEVLRERWRLYAGLVSTWAILAGLVTLSVRRRYVGIVHEVTPLDYLLNQATFLVRYVGLSLWPDPLVLDYGLASEVGLSRAAPAIALIALALGAVALAAWRAPWLAFLGASFFLVLSPTSLLPLATEVAAERRMYLPLLAVVLLVVLGVHRVLGALAERTRRPRLAPWLGGTLAVAALTMLGWMTFQRNAEYRDPSVLWRTVIDAVPDNPRAYNNLGVSLYEEGEVEAAIGRFRDAVELDPTYHGAYYNLSRALESRGDLEGAIASYRKALEVKPDFANAHNNLGRVLRSVGRTEEAIAHYRRAIESDPRSVRAHNNLGVALQSQGRVGEAIEHYRRAVRLDPNYADAHANLGLALGRVGRKPEAMRHLDEALRLNPDQPLLLIELAALVTAQSDAGPEHRRRAVELAKRAAELTGHENPRVVAFLAEAYALAGRLEEAVFAGRHALALASRAGDEALESRIRTRLTQYERILASSNLE